MKKWIFVVLSFVLAAVVTLTVVYVELANAKVDGGHDFGTPSKILVYSASYTPIEFEKDDKEFDKILKLFSNSGKTNMFNELLNDFQVNETLRQVEEPIEWKSVWKESTTSFVVEFVFDEIQSCVAFQQNNSKKIDFGSLIFVVSDSNEFVDTFIFFRTTLNTSITSSSPLVVQIKTNKLFNFIKSVD